MLNATVCSNIRSLLLAGVALTAGIWINGCGGGETAGYDIPADPSVIYFTPILKVIDDDGAPVGNALVYIDDEFAQPMYTCHAFVTLGDGYSDFTGREANWISDIYQVPRPDTGSSTCIYLRVSKDGYSGDSTYFNINWDAPNRLFGYDTLTLSASGPLSAQSATTPKTHHPELAAGPPIPAGAKTIPLPRK